MILALAASLSLSAAAADFTPWRAWRTENAACMASISVHFRGAPAQADVDTWTEYASNLIASIDDGVAQRQAVESAGALKAQMDGRISREERVQAQRKIVRAADIQHAYIHGSLHPRILSEAFPGAAPANIQKCLVVRYERARYLTDLSAEPVGHDWAGDGGSISNPVAAGEDGK